jgi:3-oxoacyl-[acyl-carrier protein] reductase
LRPGLSRILVLGGSGTVGAEVVRLVAPSAPTTFTFHEGEARARALAEETGARARRVDLRDGAAVRALPAALEGAPEVLIHCAAIGRFGALGELTEDGWDERMAVNCRAPFTLCRLLAPGLRAVVLVGAMDRAQSLPLPVDFAATQGALAGMTVALAKELGPAALVNMVALGPLEAGLSRGLSPRLLEDYRKYSALQRLGTAAEAARAIAWMALENRYMSGKVLSVNGGI